MSSSPPLTATAWNDAWKQFRIGFPAPSLVDRHMRLYGARRYNWLSFTDDFGRRLKQRSQFVKGFAKFHDIFLLDYLIEKLF